MMLALPLEEFQEFVGDLVQVMRKWYLRAGSDRRSINQLDRARKVFMFVYTFPTEEDSG